MRKNSWVSLGRVFGRDQSGSTAIEFALLAAPFTMILVAIVELSLMFVSGSLLESATSSAARQIRTGSIQRAGGTPEQQEEAFRTALCAQASALIPCEEIDVEVLNIGAFQSFGNFGPSYDEDGDFSSQGFDPGGVSDVILIRAFYRYSYATPLVGNLLSAGGSGTRDFLSTIVVQNEPYEF